MLKKEESRIGRGLFHLTLSEDGERRPSLIGYLRNGMRFRASGIPTGITL
jgi:hypothetical protein